jgi:hypothetical protein
VISSPQRPLPGNTTLTTDRYTSLRCIRTQNLSRRAAADLRFIRRAHWDWHEKKSNTNSLLLLLLLLVIMHYNSGRVLAFSTMTFHLGRSWTCSVHLTICIRLMSSLISSSHRDLGFPAGLPVRGFHLYIFFTTLVTQIHYVFKLRRGEVMYIGRCKLDIRRCKLYIGRCKLDKNYIY